MGTLMDPSRAHPDHVSVVELTLVYHNLLRQ
jgi:predicted 2-oxoglutarate/Fe(II)-dependent dioxygenase YbiX